MADKYFIAKREDIIAVCTTRAEYGYDPETDSYKTVTYIVNVYLRGCDTVCIECGSHDEMIQVFDEIQAWAQQEG